MYLAMGKTLADNTPVPILSVRLAFDEWLSGLELDEWLSGLDECLSGLDGGSSPHVHPDQRPA